MLLPLPKSNLQVPWEKSLMFLTCGWTQCQRTGSWQGAGSADSPQTLLSAEEEHEV